MSHDLRGPLQAILLTADAIAGGADVVEGVGRIQRSAGRMLRLIDDLLDASSIEAGQLAMKRQAHHPGGLVHEALASHEVAAAAKGLTMSAALDPHLPEVHGDAGRILQVLANLIGNAIHVVGRAGRGHITVSATVEDRAIVFAVADDGPGIDQASQAHLFDRYWRSEAAGYKGTGLGLAIASGIVVAHGGRIWVESELGVGATFFFTIPCADDTPLFAAPVADEAAT